MRFRNFKAQGGLDIPAILADFFIGIILLFAAWVIWTSFATNPQTTTLVRNSPTAQNAITNGTAYQNGVNNIAAFGIIFLLIGAMIASSQTDAHPIFAFVAFLISPVVMLLAFAFHDVFFQLAINSYFALYISTYPWIGSIFQILPILTFIGSIIIGMITAKNG